MADLRIRTASGQDTRLPAAEVERLASGLRGGLLTAGAPGYDQARTIWNAMIDKRPAAIARCSGAADVLSSVRFAAEHSLLLAVRGGGHNIAGSSVCDGGLMVDLSPMRGVRVDPHSRTARVGPGSTLADFDHEAQAFGLATPLGINSTTGVAGLTLGGGFGWLTRKHGLTIDNLISADVVTADGRLLHVHEEENSDLFWGIRGGGGNFGVVTSFEFALHPVGPNVLAGLIVYGFAEGRKVLEGYRDFTAKSPDDLTVWSVIRKAPPLPFLPPDVHGKEVVVLALVWVGDPEKGKKVVEPLSRLGKPVGEHVGVVPYAAFQQAFDPLLTPGARNYWKSHDFERIDDGLLDVLLESAGRLPSPQCEIFLAQLGGAAARVAPDATAYHGRNANFIANVHGRWDDPKQDAAGTAWAREFFEAAKPFSTGGVYVNFMTQEEMDRVPAAYGRNFERLAGLKAKYDPSNLFRLNQNVAPKKS
jgi:FAD/FMN-containing dehydrogenase